MNKYGIINCIFGDDTTPHPTVSLGDGKTAICTVSWPKAGVSGVIFVRDDNAKPFASGNKKETQEILAKSHGGEKVYLTFSNAKSIDALISRLKEAKEMLAEQSK